MHPDRKIGIAMGILLVGVVAALFFRSEPLPVDESLSVRRENELNDRLRDRDVAVYLDGDAEAPSQGDDEYTWTLPEVPGGNRANSRPLPIAVHGDTQPHVAESSTADLPSFQPPIEHSAAPTRATEVAAPGQQVVQQATPVNSPAVAAAAPAVAPAKERADDYREYKVQYGDTLSGISKRFLGSHQSYVEIYEANRDRIEDPNRLKVGTALRIPRRYN